MADRNLWGDLPLAEEITPPATILKEQAVQLTKLTSGVLEGRVSSGTTGDQFLTNLLIYAPALNYTAGILSVQHRINLYPAIVTDSQSGQTFSIQNETQFLDTLGKVLTGERVHKLIAALVSQ